MIKADVGTIGVIGGTGNLGAALAKRWAVAGHTVLIGSRESEKAIKKAEQLNSEYGTSIRGNDNISVAEQADIIVLAVPFASQAVIISDVKAAAQGKIVVDTTVPLVPPKVMRVQLPQEGCAAVIAQQLLGENVRVVSSFHNVAAYKLATDAVVECDALVFSDDQEARQQVVNLADDAGLRGLHAGVLGNSVAAEAMTSILIFMNRHYAVDGAGIQITGKLDMTSHKRE